MFKIVASFLKKVIAPDDFFLEEKIEPKYDAEKGLFFYIKYNFYIGDWDNNSKIEHRNGVHSGSMTWYFADGSEFSERSTFTYEWGFNAMVRSIGTQIHRGFKY